MFINSMNNNMNVNAYIKKENNNLLLNDHFYDYMKLKLNEINIAHNNNLKKSQDFMLNKSDVSLSDLMIDLQKTSIAIHMAVEIRNKLISGYQEIMNMQI